MIDSVKVIYGFSVGKVSFLFLTERLNLVCSKHHVDYDVRITKNNLCISVYPFKNNGAKEISETEGAEILRSLIYLCENWIDDGILLSVEMATALPF